MERTNISTGQFFTALFVSRISAAISLNAQYAGGGDLLDSAASCLLALAASGLMALPLWLALRLGGGKSLPQLAVEGGWLGRLVPAYYLFFLVFSGGSALGMFQVFLGDTMDPDFSSGLVSAALLGVALYGALRGLETVGRCGACVFAALVLGGGLVFGMAAVRFDPDNLEPLFYHGLGQTARSFPLFLARTSIFAEMAVLLPQVKGRRALGFGGWLVGTGLFLSGLLVLVVGCLGRYASTQNFPVYVLASLSQVRSLRRLDALFTGLWMMGLIIQLAMGLYACRVCFRTLGLGKKEPRWSLWLAAGAMLGLGLLTAGSTGLQGLTLNPNSLAWWAAGAGTLAPLLALVLGLRGKGKKPPQKEKR
ncbi:GerAB/ArcD/ProY family transporter [Acutalibacter sp.]|uniref:GerAB/ArcD/ProY family transporter n=1 Tax=Acutalibacter sp. TaxID=1918636 RepID=UPI0021725506|nr:GerAB/ArcD/ProY family transporter [Acutalibacter sp.]